VADNESVLASNQDDKSDWPENEDGKAVIVLASASAVEVFTINERKIELLL
jgi:hypothetical protein